MAPTDPGRKPSGPSPSSGLLNGFFSLAERLAYFHSVPVVVIALLGAVLSLWLTAHKLEFYTGQTDLMSDDLRYHRIYQDFRSEFEEFGGMLIVVEGKDSVSMKNFTEALAKKLEGHRSSFVQIFYRIEIDYFKDKAFLYLEKNELDELKDALEENLDFLETVNGSPGLNTLMRSINAEISAGMVDTLLSDFIGSSDEETENAQGNPADLSLLIALLKQMDAHLNGDTAYQSPWLSFLSKKSGSLEEEGYLVSEDGSLMFIMLNPKATEGDFRGAQDTIDLVRGLVAETKKDHPDVEVGVTGEAVIAADEMSTTQIDVTNASQIALIGVALLFILIYRGIVDPLLAVFSLMVALSWAMGYTTLVVGHLNIISVVFTTILIGLGIDFGIHVLQRYREERNSGREVYQAIQKTVHRTGRGNFAGAITTAIAFGSMTLTDFIGLAELGWIAGGGIIICLLAMIILLPALITIREKFRRGEFPKTEKSSTKRKRYEVLFDHHRWVIGVCLVLFILSCFALKDLQFDYNLLNLQAKGTEAVRYEMKVIEHAKRATWHAAMVSDNLKDAREKFERVNAMDSVGRVESIFSVLPKDQEEKIKSASGVAELVDDLEVESEDEIFSLDALSTTINKIRFKLRKKEKSGDDDPLYTASQLVKKFNKDLKQVDPAVAESRLKNFSAQLFADYRGKIADLQKAAHPTPVKIEELPDLLKKRFIGKSGKYLIEIYPEASIWEREPMERFLADLREVDPDVTGNAVHMYESTGLMQAGYIEGGIYAMIAIIIYVFAAFRNLRTTLLILLPTWVGSAWTVGIMNLLDLKFNLANLVILPLIIGIGVVNGIHIVHRYREEADKSSTVLSKSTGKAVTLSSLTTMIGFGSLMIADHQGVHSLGLLLTIGVGSCLVASVTLLPALLKHATLKGWKI